MKSEHVDAICRVEQKIESLKITVQRLCEEHEMEDENIVEGTTLQRLDDHLTAALRTCDKIRAMR